MAETSIIHQWYPKGCCPKAGSLPSRKSVAHGGFIVPETGELFVTKPGWFNYETTMKIDEVETMRIDGQKILFPIKCYVKEMIGRRVALLFGGGDIINFVLAVQSLPV